MKAEQTGELKKTYIFVKLMECNSYSTLCLLILHKYDYNKSSNINELKMHVILCENICVIKLLERNEDDYLKGVFHTLSHPPVYILQVTLDTSVTE